MSAINAGIEQRLFGLSPGEDWWPGAALDGDGGERGLFRFAFDGTLDAVASVAAISGDELSFHVVLNPRRPEMVPDHFRGLDGRGRALQAGAAAGRLGPGWQRGLLVQACGAGALCGAAIAPNGYSDQGSFFM